MDTETPTTLDRLPEVLTVEEVARYLRVSERTVYEMVRRGRMRALRVGGRGRGGAVRVTREALLRFLAGPAPNPEPAATRGRGRPRVRH